MSTVYRHEPNTVALHSQQQGVALLVVLLIVAMVTVLATEMVTRLQLNVSRTLNIKSSNQAYWLSMGAEQFAKKSLAQLRSLNPDTINLSQPWAEPVKFPIEGGSIEATLVDMHACFNLNSINGVRSEDQQNTAENSTASTEVNANAATNSNNDNANTNSNSNSQNTNGVNNELEAFTALVRYSDEQSIDSFTADTLAQSLADWVDSDADMRDYGAEDAEYESLVVPYVAANSLLSNTSELRLINGADIRWLASLMPQVCVLPDDSRLAVNVNTLTEEQAPVLAALSGIGVGAARSLIAARPLEGYADLADFMSAPELANLSTLQKSWFTVKSNYFMLQTKTRYNGAVFKMQSVFQVFGSEQITILSREFGGAS